MDINPSDFERMTEEEMNESASKAFTKAWLKRCAFNFGDSKNPIYVWLAIDHCSFYKVSFPEWVLDYLKTASFNLTKYAFRIDDKADESEKSVKRKKSASEITYDALLMNKGRGPGNTFSRFNKDQRDLKLMAEVYSEIEKGEKNLKTIHKEVSKKNGISYSVVKSLWNGNESKGQSSFEKILKFRVFKKVYW